MSYSRRQLYALGEPLGDSATYRKADGGLILGDGGGGGGGSAPANTTSTTTQTAELPEWARGYAKEALAKGQALTDVNQNPYQQYTQPRIAGFSPLQQQVQQGVAGLQMPSEYGAASQAAGQGIAQALSAGQYQPSYFGSQYQAPQDYAPGQFSMLQAQAPNLQQYQMGPAERVRTDQFTGQQVGQYMNPYLQYALAPQLAEANRQFDITGTKQQSAATQAGAFGGSREAIMAAENERNRNLALQNIVGQGYNQAYQNAQQQFNQQQQANLQARMANQQAGLTVGQQNLAAMLGVQQLGAGQNLQAQLANQQALQAAQQAAEQSRQYGYGQGMTASQLAAQYGLAGQQAAEQSRQFGAGLGLQGAQAGIQGAGQLAGIGGQGLQAQQGIYGLQGQVGAQQQALQQQGLTQAYQDFINQQNYPYKQLGFMSDLIRGLPLGQQSTAAVYQPPGSISGQIAGLGIGALGLSQLGKMFAEGGEVHEYAGGGSTSIKNMATDPEQLQSLVHKYPATPEGEQALLAELQRAQSEGNDNLVEAIKSELGFRKSMRSGLAGTVTPQMADDMMPTVNAANGGIVAFAKGGDEGELLTDPLGNIIGGDSTTGKDFSFNEKNRLALERAERNIEESRRPKLPVGEPYNAATATRRSDFETPTKSKPGPEVFKGLTDISRATGISADSIKSYWENLTKQLDRESQADLSDLEKLANKYSGRSEQIKQEGLGRALAEFGFKWAQSAARPGSRFLGSAAESSPVIMSSLARTQELQQAAEDNQLRINIAMKQAQIAQKQGNRQLAAQFAQHANMLELENQKIKQQHALGMAHIGAIREGNAIRGLSQLNAAENAKARMAQVRVNAGKAFDAGEGSRLRRQYEQQYKGQPEKINYLLNTARNQYISDSLQTERNKMTDESAGVRSVYDLLGE